MSTTKARLPAAERRAALVEAALRVFAAGSYRSVTTAEIARAAGVSEPILYRHFASKRDLYLSCVDEAWRRLREAWDRIRAEEGAADWMPMMGRYAFREVKSRTFVSALWLQAVTEASADGEIRRYMRRHLKEVHDYLVETIADAQRAGAVIAERDPAAEAWIFLAVGLLGTVGRQVGGLLDEGDLERIVVQRRRWLLVDPD